MPGSPSLPGSHPLLVNSGTERMPSGKRNAAQVVAESQAQVNNAAEAPQRLARAADRGWLRRGARPPVRPTGWASSAPHPRAGQPPLALTTAASLLLLLPPCCSCGRTRKWPVPPIPHAPASHATTARGDLPTAPLIWRTSATLVDRPIVNQQWGAERRRGSAAGQGARRRGMGCRTQ